MKCAHFLGCLVLGMLFSAEAHAALLGLNPNAASPFYADFNTTGLKVSYNYNSASGVGTFTVTNNSNVTKPEQYTSGASSPGTHGVENGNSSPVAFSGFYSLTATIKQDANNQWDVTGGSFSVEGTLFGGVSTDLLLTGTLKTGAGSFGWSTPTANEFDFLFNTSSGGNSAILADFFGAGSGAGAIELHQGSSTYSSLTANWVNTGVGFADTFVPEPAIYPFAAAGTAIFGLLLASRKTHRANWIAA